MAARMIYLLIFYFGFGYLFREYRNLDRFIRAYGNGLTPVMLNSILVLSILGFKRNMSPVMAEPFFDDHTVFGACIAGLTLSVNLGRWPLDQARLARWDLAVEG